MAETAKGRLLVATPVLVDANFARTVLLMIEHSDDGALGVVLNRPSETAVGDPLPRWDDLAAPPELIFVGGPVAPDVAVCLGRLRPGQREGRGMQLISPGVVTLDLDTEPDEVAPTVGDLRIFAGYAGWGAGQLEDELGEGAWVIVDAFPDDFHTAEPLGLWRAVLRRQRSALALLANHPVDARRN
ncbi:MAG: putative transcriptional regulator [Actinomycetota bacterium]|jgi:putative transcriptional regulator|nr:putative transcriptional regulator [Actinomycetota bacterium]